MGKVYRCFVEKKPGYDVEASHLLAELKGTLGLKGLSGVRVIRRYDVEGVDQGAYGAARTTVLSEPQVDTLVDEEFPLPGDCRVLAVEALPGQCYADAQAAQLLQEYRAATGQGRDLSAKRLYERLAEEPPFAVLCFKNWSVLTQWSRISGLTPTQQNVFYGFAHWDIA